MFLPVLLLPSMLLMQSSLAIANSLPQIERDQLAIEATRLMPHEVPSNECDSAVDRGAEALDAVAFSAGAVMGTPGRDNPYHHSLRSNRQWSRRCASMLAPTAANAGATGELDERNARVARPWERMAIGGEIARAHVEADDEVIGAAAGAFAAAGLVMIQQSHVMSGGTMRNGPQGTSVEPVAGPGSGYGLRLTWQMF